MQVNLKQYEIETALKNYISQQGISLAGKLVEISFTAGRKESGISAEMSIEESAIPDFGAPEEDVPLATITPIIALQSVVEPVEAVEEDVVALDPVCAAEAPKTTSLFG